MAKAIVSAEIQAVIKEAVNAGIQAGRLQDARTAGDTYKLTEKRLYAYPVLCDRIKDNREGINDIQNHGTKQRSKSLARFNRSGIRVSPEELLEAVISDLKAQVAADQHEVDTINKALEAIKDDPYYLVIKGKFFKDMGDEKVAEAIPCDPSTVRRNRGRLVRKLAVWLYGSQAL